MYNIKVINSIPNIIPGATAWDSDKDMDILIASLIGDWFYQNTLRVGRIDDTNTYYVETPTGFQAIVGYFLGKPAILHKLPDSDYRTLDILEFV